MLRRSSITNKCSQCTGTKFLKENLRHYISIIKSPPFIQKWGMLCYSSSTIVVIGLGFRRSSSVVELLFTPFLWSWTIGRQIRKGIVHRGKEVVIECILVLYSNSTNYILHSSQPSIFTKSSWVAPDASSSSSVNTWLSLLSKYIL